MRIDDYDAEDEKEKETDETATGKEPEILIHSATASADDVLAVTIAVPQLASADFTPALKAKTAEPSLSVSRKSGARLMFG